MTEQVSLTSSVVEKQDEDKAPWPRSYRLEVPPGQTSGPTKPWWSYSLYRGPQNKTVKVLYSKTKAQSEILAQQFLDEPVIGFDMEWPWPEPKHNRLQDKIGLIQLACEDMIALFHIGLHVGTQTDDLIAPSLRKIIESPNIAKTGVSVMNADFNRLIKYFDLKPQAAFELSHLHSLVTYGARKPELVTTKLVNLAYQVKDHLGLPLFKGEERTSNWSKPLNQKQIDYAATDAYAGFMLYHCMNAKRMAMDPTPPLPLFADKYKQLPFRKSSIRYLLLEPSEKGGNIIAANDFFGMKEEEKEKEEKVTYGASSLDPPPLQEQRINPQASATKPERKTQAPKPKKDNGALDTVSQALYDQLSLRRKTLAKNEGVPAYCIAVNTVLEDLARQRPLNDNSLLRVNGIGKVKQAKYGAEWLEVITTFLAANDFHPSRSGNEIASTPGLDAKSSKPNPTTSIRESRRRKMGEAAESQESTHSSPAFGSPLHYTPQLHTGLSFAFENANLDQGKLEMSEEDSSDGAITSSIPTSQLKRKRAESPLRAKTPPPSTVQPSALTPRSRIYRNKLLAFSRQITSKLKSRPSKAIVSECTLDQIVATSPRTMEELNRIPGIESFIEACKQVEKDLLANIIRFAPAKF